MPATPAFTAQAMQDETVDQVVWRILGVGSPTVERVLDANDKLAGLGPLLPEGTPVYFPAIDTGPPPIALIQLWS